MLEWMHSENVTKNLSANFAAKTLEDCEGFIRHSIGAMDNIHLAIASDADEYMGTVSLKRVNREAGTAEFAITVREAAMGKCYSWFGMLEILRLAFEKYGLEKVYWCVSRRNARAVRFYDKHKFPEAMEVPQDLLDCYTEIPDLKWYVVGKGDVAYRKALPGDRVCGCSVVKITTIPTEGAGELSFFEADKDIPFPIKRIYYISKVPEGVRRGFHAHKELKQLLFCPYGKIQLILDDGNSREEVLLDDPSVGVMIDRPMWREMVWLQKDSALCVAASDYYIVEDYIRDYQEFIKYQESRGAKQ